VVSATTRWRKLPTWARAGVAAVVVLVVINVGLGLLDGATRGADQSGSRSSSFSTAATGTAGYADLLERYGHPTRRFRGELRRSDVGHHNVLMILDAGTPTRAERRAVEWFLELGGRLVVGGPDALAWTDDRYMAGSRGIDPGRVHWQPTGPRITRTTVEGESYRVHTDGNGSWSTSDGRSLTEELEPVVRLNEEPGVNLVVADTSPLQNRRLDELDNAAFGLALAGDNGRPVVFLEGPHGYDSGSGLDVIPGRWKVALVGGALAALLTLIAASRRIGPAEETVRRLPPPRRAYVDAVGVALARTRQPAEAIAPVQAAAREHLARRAGIPADAIPDDIRAAATREGWSTAEIDALYAPATDNESILAAGAALARAEKGAP
jgi:hypothetical protein